MRVGARRGVEDVDREEGDRWSTADAALHAEWLRRLARQGWAVPSRLMPRAIPGFMGAIMMSYPVKNEHLLGAVSPSDSIKATIARVCDEYRLEDIETSKRKTP